VGKNASHEKFVRGRKVVSLKMKNDRFMDDIYRCDDVPFFFSVLLMSTHLAAGWHTRSESASATQNYMPCRGIKSCCAYHVFPGYDPSYINLRRCHLSGTESCQFFSS
jgi:hypothetical protein